MAVDSIANPTAPLANVVPSFCYQQYADDANIVAFFTAYNQLAQAYLNWATQTPLALYTSPNVSGPLLDWIGQGIYGVSRPVFSTLATKYQPADLDGIPLDTMAINSSTFSQTGGAVIATDDFYKRSITWQTYIGDGRTFNAMVIRKRIARFLYGVNGSDITLSQTQTVSIAVQTSPLKYLITLPAAANPASTYLSEALSAGTLNFPFMLNFGITIV